MKNIDHKKILFQSTGRVLPAQGGVVGIELSPFHERVYTGYGYCLTDEKLEIDELIELSEFMIDNWSQFRDKQIIKKRIKETEGMADINMTFEGKR